MTVTDRFTQAFGNRRGAGHRRPCAVPASPVVLCDMKSTDGCRASACFDAAPWLEQLTDAELLEYASENWQWGEASWKVGRLAAAEVEQAAEVFDHLRAVENLDALPGPGFEVAVEVADVHAWVRARRPHLLSSL